MPTLYVNTVYLYYKMKRPSKSIIALLTSLLSPIALATPAYQLYQRVPGMTGTAAQPAAPSLVGDGVSTAGACASGASGCAVWNATGLAPALTISGTPALNLYTTDCHTSASCDAQATKSLSSGKWYWEIKLTTLTAAYGGMMFGLTTPGGRLNTTNSVYYYTYNGGQFYKSGIGQTQTNAGLVQGDRKSVV